LCVGIRGALIASLSLTR